MDYWFDEHDRIAAVDDAWSEFAIANDAPELTPESAVGLHLRRQT